MQAYAKPGEKIHLHRCGEDDEHSFFFDLIDPHFQGNKPLHRVCTLMRKLKARVYVLETLSPNKELQEEFQDIDARCGVSTGAVARRLSFFNDVPSTEDWKDLSPASFLGYAVLITHARPDAGDRLRSYVLEAVVRVPGLLIPASAELQDHSDMTYHNVSNYYVHCTREYTGYIGPADKPKQFPIRGSFFCQQNDLTHICAHATLRMAINNIRPDRLGLTGLNKITNREINDILGIDHTQKCVGDYAGDNQGGLDSNEIEAVIDHIGLDYHVCYFGLQPGKNYADYIYPIIESDFPVILGLTTTSSEMKHVVTVVGHTLNSDRWDQEARRGYGVSEMSPYSSASSWADHFIINDDNYGMYCTLPNDSILDLPLPGMTKKATDKEAVPAIYALFALGIVPKRTTIEGINAEVYASMQVHKVLDSVTQITKKYEEEGKSLSGINRWTRYAARLTVGKQNISSLICRTLLISGSEYDNYLRKVRDASGVSLDDQTVDTVRSLLSDDYYWLTEISVPELYTANKSKLGDVLVSAQSSRDDVTKVARETLVGECMCPFAWLTDRVFLDGFSRALTWPFTAHVPLYRGGDSGRAITEW